MTKEALAEKSLSHLLKSEMREDGVILDYKGNDLVGVTILEASQR